jgi:uncharacterized protein YjiS (DUF1127 family)
MTDARLVPVCRAVPSRRIAFGGAVLFIALSLAAVLLRHWQRRIEERRVRARLSELDDHRLKDIGVTRADVLFGNVATLARTTGTVGHRRQEIVMKRIARTKGSKIYLPNVGYMKNSISGSREASHVGCSPRRNRTTEVPPSLARKPRYGGWIATLC